MKLTPDVYKQIQQHLGISASAVQNREGRGVWIIKSDTPPQYIIEKKVRILIHDSHHVDVLMKMIEDYDPATQAVFVYKLNDRQIVGIINIEIQP